MKYNRATRKFILLVSIFGLGGAGEALSAEYGKAKLLIRNSDVAKDVVIHDIHQGMVKITLSAMNKRAELSLKDVSGVRFYLGAAVEKGMDALDEGEFASAEKFLREPVFKLMPFLSFANHNVDPVVEAYEVALHRLNDAELLKSFYQRSVEEATPEKARVAKAWLAYLDARSGRMSEVIAVFDGLGKPELDDEVALLRNLALCRVELQQKNYGVAVAHAATVVASGGVADFLYPEAMVLSAQCYEGLAGEELVLLDVQRKAQVVRALLIERVKVARELEATADKQKKPPPTEEQILSTIDHKAVNRSVAALPALRELEPFKTAQRSYLFVDRVFPDTTWGKLAADRVLPESKEGKDQQLVMSEEGSDPQSVVSADTVDNAGGAVKEGRTREQYIADAKKWHEQNDKEFILEATVGVFDAADVNKNGLATPEELANYRAQLQKDAGKAAGKGMTKGQYLASEQVKFSKSKRRYIARDANKRFSAIDVNKDNVASPEELAKYHEKMAAKKKK